MGYFAKRRLESKLRESELAFDIERVEQAHNAVRGIYESPSARYAGPMASDGDDHNWILAGQSSSNLGTTLDGNPAISHYDMLASAFNFYYSNLHARAIVRNLSKFVLGKGPIITPRLEEGVILSAKGNKVDPAKNLKIQEILKDFMKENKWNLREKEMVMRCFRDGEIFIRYFINTSNGKVTIRFIRANLIRTPKDKKGILPSENVDLGIGTAKSDIERVKHYYLCNSEGNFVERIAAKEMLHIKLLADSDMLRGVSFILSAMPMIKKYESWLDDRVLLNRVRSAIALIKQVDGTASTVKTIRDQNMARKTSSERNRQRAMRGGTVLTATKGVEYKMLSPNINAQDVKDDGRAMLLTVAAGMGMPEMILTADYSNANYSSTFVAQNPFVREIEDWQDFFETHYKEILAVVLQAAIDYGPLPNDTKTEVQIEWPPLILADIEKNNKAREIQHRNKILSKITWMKREGLDPDIEIANAKLEEEIPALQGFNMPEIPTNQFGGPEDQPGKTPATGQTGAGINQPKK